MQCTDAKWPGWKRTQADSWRIHLKHPFLTWGNTWYNAPCLNWPAASQQAVRVDGSRISTKILLIAETNDAATVYSGALATRKAFPSSYLIEGVGGTTHSGSLSGIDCTDNTIATYLDTGALPARKPGNRSDQQCDPVPAPEPAAAAGLRARKATGGSPDRMPADLRAGLQEAQAIGR
ncbi:alpha/beta hydrolase [Nocardioides convexus]|uniref:alpha/beta hydrolase n=1 Tax=Nocardioides convexus TaxID=2712224 RepID=UPI00241852AB|nr:alpha/beta hydrolase [Nocardioides convexus]